MADYFADDPGQTETPQYTDTTPQPTKKHETGWIVLVAVVSLSLILIGILILTWHTTKSFQTTPSTDAPVPCSSQVSTLPDISSNKCCDNTVNKQFTNPAGLVFIAGPTAQPLSNVCPSYCAPGAVFDSSNNTCSAFPPGTATSSENSFNACVTAMDPAGCTGVAKPIATNNGVPYYAQASTTTCQTQTECPAS